DPTRKVKVLWGNIVEGGGGVAKDGGENWWWSLLTGPHVPEAVGEAQAWGLLYYLRLRDQVLHPADYLTERLGAITHALYFSLLGEPITSRPPLRPPPRYDPPRLLKRRGWYAFGQFIWNWYADCKDEGTDDATEIARRISQ